MDEGQGLIAAGWREHDRLVAELFELQSSSANHPAMAVHLQPIIDQLGARITVLSDEIIAYLGGKSAATPEPAPKPGNEVVLDYVLKDLRDRAEFGKRKYGTYLMTNNGRDTLMDLYQELLDAAMYARKLLLERGEK